jgi:hypothetical protein
MIDIAHELLLGTDRDSTYPSRRSGGVPVANSVTELSLSFYFREETPAEILSAFQPMYRPNSPDASWEPAPPLLPFRPASEDDWWVPDWKEAGYPEDALAAEPWRHNWAAQLDEGVPPSRAALVWTPQRLWHFSCHCEFQVWPDAIHDFLGWLGPFIKTTDNQGYPRPDLVGTMVYDSSLRPYLLFCQHGRLSLQSLNGPDDEF